MNQDQIDPMERVFKNIAEERCRQEEKWGEQNHSSWADITIEELSEAIDENNIDRRRQELVQLGAVIVAWIEKIDRELKQKS